MALVKARDGGKEGTVPSGAPMSQFKDYDLDSLNMPMEARPRVGGNHLGKHGYTLKSSSGAVSCPILLQYL